MNTRCDVEKATFRCGFAKSGASAGPRGARFGPRLGHVLGRGTRLTPVSQCEMERRRCVLRRHFCDVQKATSRCCFAKYVTPADGGQKHAPLLLWSSHAKSSKIAVMIIIIDWGGGFWRVGRVSRSGSKVTGRGQRSRGWSSVFGRRVCGLWSFGLRSEVFWSWVFGL